MAMSVAVARYRRYKSLSTAMASPWREGSRRVATAVAKDVQQAQWLLGGNGKAQILYSYCMEHSSTGGAQKLLHGTL